MFQWQEYAPKYIFAINPLATSIFIETPEYQIKSRLSIIYIFS